MSVRWRRVFTEVYRFLAVGGLATVVAFVIFNFLVHGLRSGWEAPLRDHPYLAFVVANVVGMVVSYRGSRRWVFKDRPPRTADGGLFMFVVINLVTMLIPIICLWVSRNVLGLADPVSDNISANVLGLFVGMVARFYLFRTLVFRRPVHLVDIAHHPLQVFELGEPGEPGEPGEFEGSQEAGAEISGTTTARSTTDPVPRPAP